ncbi:glycerophosphoryl diester phosphodiesterase [Sphingomonas jejuensis]|uniref:glycerophosphodiester phosphodiesterase n=1 Tax=Sphingomonas jejuensis TaxID=904715 RepID=A0ABX0XPI0_9SPHN|nr:glycerophosphodiester phosphodiesterase family protein [Sphingomonas jejuensis]NJC34596.1 glycerophosphoryl diester phosphodiesterase [Sphingomonas jejuensis]
MLKLTRRSLAAAAILMTTATAAIAQPKIYGHRGASAYRPEHTLASYELAIDQGADFVEPDLVSTKDGVLVARHENYINETTDVASRPEFAGRRTTKVIDGVSYTGWFTEDFTLAELKTLRAVERIPQLRPDNVQYNGQFEVPTLQEVIDLVRRKEAETGRRIGIIPETKHPTYFDTIGLSLEEPLVRTLSANGYDGADDLALIQSFEVGNLVELNQLTELRLVQLTTGVNGRPFDFVAAGDTRTYGALLTKEGLEYVASYADVLGPDKNVLIPRDANGNLTTPTSVIADAHAAGLEVVPYTFRPENVFLPTNLRNGTDPAAYGNDQAEFLAFLNAGVDGLFADAPDRARAAVTLFSAVPEPASWGMMIAGFGLTGAAMRRRRKGGGSVLA